MLAAGLVDRVGVSVIPMHGVCFISEGHVQWREIPDPSIESATDAIVEVEIAGLCGSDLHPFFGRERGLDAGTVMGHEFVGRVVDVGAAVRDIRVGDRVCAPFSTSCGHCAACRSGLTSRCEHGQLFGWRQGGVGLHGGQAGKVRVPLADGTLVRVPDGMAPEVALLLGDNFSTAWFCAELAGVAPGRIVVVIGSGSVGLLGIIAARAQGARAIVAVDPVVERRARAEALGALAVPPGPDVVAGLHELGGRRGADCVMEVVGLPGAQRLAWEVVRPGGVIAAIGCHCAPFAFTPAEAYDKNLTYRTGRCPARHYMARLAERARTLPGIGEVITHRFAAADAVQAYDVFAHQRGGCIKALLEF